VLLNCTRDESSAGQHDIEFEVLFYRLQFLFTVPNLWDCAAGAVLNSDPPPLKWSDLRYVFDIKEDCNGKEAIQV
jgi:hypothetical protein